ncbi:hypothetical protein [Burkholderia paludis]|uniref:hypothetical protein n=1 Tax=Burkholderia paludis TaxID=1506587 RepID=UPI00126A3BE6|nr:hypothetical protein [Burkholderia paludis]
MLPLRSERAARSSVAASRGASGVGAMLAIAVAFAVAAIGEFLPRESMSGRRARRRSPCTETRQACPTPWKA